MRMRRLWVKVVFSVALLWAIGAPWVSAAPSVTPGAPPSSEQAAVLTSDISNSTTTLVDVSGLTCSVGAGLTYRFEYMLIMRSTNTDTGIRLALAGPASPTLVSFGGQIPYAPAGVAEVLWTAFDDPLIGLGMPGPNLDNIGVIRGTVTAGVASGLMFPRFASEVGASAVTIKAGSTMKCRQF
jgi:hypothetical protein